MPPRLRLSLDTSQPSRPADLYPTVTLSERQIERVGAKRNAERKGKETEGWYRGGVWGGYHKERMEKVKGCNEVREQIERRGKEKTERQSEGTRIRKRGGWRGKNEGAMRLWIIQKELKGGRVGRRDWKWQPLRQREGHGKVQDVKKKKKAES